MSSERDESYEPEAIDPLISTPTSDVSSIPVVRSSAAADGHAGDNGSSGGFVKSLTSSIASSWHASTEAEAVLEWEEYDAEAADRAAEERDDDSSARHEFTPDPDFQRTYSAVSSAVSASSAEELDTSTYSYPEVQAPQPMEPNRYASDPVQGGARDYWEAFPQTGEWSQTEALGPQIPTSGHAESTAAWAQHTAEIARRQQEQAPPSGVLDLAFTSPISTLPSSPLEAAPLPRRSVLRPSRIREKLNQRRRKNQQLFDRTVFDQKLNPQHVQQAFRRIMRPEAPMTSAVPIIDRLEGTPFANPQQAEAPMESEEPATIAFVLDLGETLFRYGAGALEVETSIIATTTAFGMKNTDVDITNQSISLNWAPEGKIPYSRVRVVRSWSSNYKALAAVHELVTDIVAGRMTRSDAEKRLHEITREPKPFPRWMVTVAGGFFASFFASFLGAPLLDAALGFFGTLIVLWLTRQLATWRVPEYFCLAAGGFIASFLAMGAFTMGVNVTPSMVVAGSLMILLPSTRVVSAIQDAINGFPITSAGRLLSSMIAFAGMTAGIMGAVVIWDLMGAPHIVIADGLTRIYPAPVLILLVFFAGSSAAIVEQARWRMILPIGAVSALGFAGFYVGELIGLGERITPIIGATIVGALGRVVALRMGAPQLVVAVPAMMFMLPGLMVFRGMYQIAIENPETTMVLSMTSGLAELFNAMIIILAIASGIVLGDVSMRPLTSSLQSNERSRTRNR